MKNIKKLLLGSAASLILVAGVSQAEVRIGIDPAPYLPFSAESASGQLEGWEIQIAAVSYTHLTLPTIYSV